MEVFGHRFLSSNDETGWRDHLSIDKVWNRVMLIGPQNSITMLGHVLRMAVTFSMLCFVPRSSLVMK